MRQTGDKGSSECDGVLIDCRMLHYYDECSIYAVHSTRRALRGFEVIEDQKDTGIVRDTCRKLELNARSPFPGSDRP